MQLRISNSSQQIETLHGIYTRQTGQAVRLDMGRIYLWEVWLAKGFTNSDLFDLIRHLRAEIREGNRRPGCLKFSNLIGLPDAFEEDLAQLRAATRPRPPTQRTVRSCQTERIVSDPGTAPRVQTPGPILEEYVRQLRASVEVGNQKQAGTNQHG